MIMYRVRDRIRVHSEVRALLPLAERKGMVTKS